MLAMQARNEGEFDVRLMIPPFRVLVVLCFALILTQARARADGCFVWKNRSIDILEPDQKAFIFHDQGREDLVLSVSFAGAPEDFGWIVPLPSLPEMFSEDSLLFSVLSEATQGRQYERSLRGARLHRTAGAEVVASRRVGIYETQIVEAHAGEELMNWLTGHGYQLPSGAERVLDRYVKEGWVFATLKITPSAIDSTTTARLRSGTIPPIRFRFACLEPVFPLEVSSVMSGGTEVLLYVLSRHIAVPRTPKPESWVNQINSRPGEQHWIYQYEHEAKTTEFLPDYQEPYYLTKHRVRFDPAEMKDVRFGPYDAAKALRSRSEAERLEAVAFLGRIKPDGALAGVLGRLRADPTRSETLSLLWALGEIGGLEAERALLKHVEASDPEVRIEAVEALGRMRSHAMLPHLVRGLESGADAQSSESTYVWKSLRAACFEWLVTLADSSCLGELNRMAEEHDGWQRWSRLAGPRGGRDHWWNGLGGSDSDAGLLAVAALAACGDTAARDTILHAVVTWGQAGTTPQAIASAAGSGGSINGFPCGFWMAHAIRSKSDGFRDWQALQSVYSLFQVAPALRTDLLERAAADPRLPRSGAIVLLGNLDTLRSAEADRLMQLWLESIREPRRYIDVTTTGHLRPAPGLVHYNYDACAVAYAFSRHRRLDELEKLWSTRPQDDPVLEGELVFAMAETRDPRFRGIVLGYVKRVWGAAARSGNVESFLTQKSFGKPESRMSFFLLESAPFDLEYRVHGIWSYLLSYPPDVEFEKTFLADRDLPPYLRLAMLSKANFFAEPRQSIFPMAQAELAALRATLTGPAGLDAQIADSLQSRFEWTARRLAERKGRGIGAP